MVVVDAAWISPSGASAGSAGVAGGGAWGLVLSSVMDLRTMLTSVAACLAPTASLTPPMEEDSARSVLCAEPNGRVSVRPSKAQDAMETEHDARRMEEESRQVRRGQPEPHETMWKKVWSKTQQEDLRERRRKGRS